MAPEQAAQGTADARSDVFGLGAVLCEILTGAPAYRGDDGMETLLQAVQADLTDALARLDGCGADAELVRLAKACLAADPAGRPADGGAVAAAVTAYLNGVQERLRAAEVEKAAARARAAEERKRRRLAWALAAAVVAVVLVGGGAWLWVTQDRAARRERADRDLLAALDEAAARREAARQVPPDDQDAWTAALAAAGHVKGLLDNGDAGEGLRRRAAALLADVQEAADSRDFLARLDNARDQAAMITPAGAFDNAGAAARYAEAFRAAGADVAALEPAEAADRLRGRAPTDDVTAALMDWAELTADAELRGRLLAVADALDPDDSFLHRWRAKRQAGADRETLVRLVDSPDAARLSPPAAALVAAGLAKAGARDRAVKLLQAALREHPSDFWLNFALADQLAGKQPVPWDEAIRYYTAARALRPGSAAVWNNLSVALVRAGKFDEAEDACRRTLALQPDAPPAHVNLGLVRVGQGRLDEAADEFGKAVKLRPGYAEAHTDLGWVRLLQGRPGEAKAECERAVALDPELPEALVNLANLHAQFGGPEDAVRECEKALLRKEFPEAHFVRAGALSVAGRPDEAEDEARRALKLWPEYADAHMLLGGMYADQGRLVEAETECREALRLKPGSAEAQLVLGIVLQAQGRLSEGLEWLRRAQKRVQEQGRGPANAPFVADAERLVELDRVLPLLLRGEAEPADADGQLRAAQLCRYRRLYAASARFAEKAFAAKSELADRRGTLFDRYEAAVASALAGCGKGDDAAPDGDGAARARFRGQALRWLRDDLTFYQKLLDNGLAVGRYKVLRALGVWRRDDDLACVRDADALARLPAEEQAEWRKLWADAGALLRKAGGER
jgi:serine/threonine-protein kinase